MITDCPEHPTYTCKCSKPVQFILEDLRLIKATCMTACPQFPSMPMYEPWASLYAKADQMIERL